MNKQLISARILNHIRVFNSETEQLILKRKHSIILKKSVILFKINNDINLKILELNQLLRFFFGFLLLCQLIFIPKEVQAAGREISEIFIEATGNNKYEAKIKAHELGMKRALLLVADQIGIKKEEVNEIPFSVLKKIFIPVMVLNENSTIEKYNATVNYSYGLSQVYTTLLKYGTSNVNDLFYECVVFPVLKQKNSFNIWETDISWNDHWMESRSLLDQYKIFYPQKTPYLANKITNTNIFALKYEDFIDLFPNVFFKKVMIITGEYFTNKKTRDGLLQIKKIVLSPENAEALIIDEEYTLVTLDDIPYTVDMVIDKVINNFGSQRQKEPDDNTSEQGEEEKNIKPIIMNFDAFDQEEMNLVTRKLKTVAEVEKFRIEHDSNTKYKIIIYTNHSEYELAEGLYLSGLSYRIHGNLYNLIDVKKGS